MKTKKNSDKTGNEVPGNINTGQVFTARNPQVQSFWDKSESGVFLLVRVLRILSYLSENAEP